MFYDQDTKTILDFLKTSEQGLKNSEAAKRQEKYGKNQLPRKKRASIIAIFLSEFKDPMILLLVVAIVASIIAGEISDAIIIAATILVDAIVGTYQERKASKTTEALENLVKVQARTLRDGKDTQLNAEELVPGDIVKLESGDKVSADMRLLEVHNLSIDESILTGESVQVVKTTAPITKKATAISDQTNMAFSGTTVITGRALAVVVKTGLSTELGKIAESLNETKEEKSPLTIRVEKLSKQISVMIVVIAVIITGLMLYKNVDHSSILITVIAFAVSAMPEGLPLALTMALTIASNRMSKRNVVVRKLHAAESLGSCTVIASDKTGTLTVNQQTARKILLPNNEEYAVTGTGYDFDGKVTGNILEYAEEIAKLGVINNEAHIDENGMSGDSIDLAFLVLGKKLKVDKSDIKILETIPYESENKYSAVFYEKDGEVYCTVKGSLEVVQEFCSKINFAKTTDYEKLVKQNEEMAKDGLRVIALANGKIVKAKRYGVSSIKDLVFMGMVGFIDPIRKEAAQSIRDCHTAGIRVMMITGDHPLTAFSIAKDLKLAKEYSAVASGVEVEEAYRQGEAVFDDFVSKKTVFARVTPLQKLHIVESLKRMGEFVAVTGDGVNDAPALKAANIGVAMGSGTDIARETADMIIMDDNFKSIVSGIEEGRVAYANIRKIIFFLLSCNLAESAFFCLAIAADTPAPLTAVQLLWLNVVTDGIQDIALSFERAEDDILKQKPHSPKESIFDKSLLGRIIASCVVMSALMFSVWWVLIRVLNYDTMLASTYTMSLFVFVQNIFVFSCRSEKRSVFSVPLRRNLFIVVGIVATIALQMIVMHVPALANILHIKPMDMAHIGILFAMALVILPIIEGIKLAFRKLEK